MEKSFENEFIKFINQKSNVEKAIDSIFVNKNQSLDSLMNSLSNASEVLCDTKQLLNKLYKITNNPLLSDAPAYIHALHLQGALSEKLLFGLEKKSELSELIGLQNNDYKDRKYAENILKDVGEKLSELMGESSIEESNTISNSNGVEAKTTENSESSWSKKNNRRSKINYH